MHKFGGATSEISEKAAGASISNNSVASVAWQSTYLLVFTVLICVFAGQWSYDDPYITYRYAENISRGVGFVYNSGEQLQSTTTPLFALILTLGSIVDIDLPRLAVLIGAVSLSVGGLCLFWLAVEHRSRAAGLVLLFLYPTFPLLITTLSSETPLYLALILGTFLAYERRRYHWTALLAALAVVTRPDGILAPGLLTLHFLLTNRDRIPWKSVILFAAINAAWFGFAWMYFGSPLPVTLAAKQHQGEMAISQRFLPGIRTVFGWYANNWGFRLEAVFALVGLAGIVLSIRRWWLLLTWTVLYFLAYSILGVTRYFWYYAPLVPGVLALVALGTALCWTTSLTWRGRNWSPVFQVISVLALVLFAYTQGRNLWNYHSYQDPRIAVYRQIGEWLRENTSSDATVGSLEVGAIGYYARRTMVDFAGLIQPDIAKQLNSQSTYEDSAVYAVEKYKPDYIVVVDNQFPRLLNDYLSGNCSVVKAIEAAGLHADLHECIWR